MSPKSNKLKTSLLFFDILCLALLFALFLSALLEFFYTGYIPFKPTASTGIILLVVWKLFLLNGLLFFLNMGIHIIRIFVSGKFLCYTHQQYFIIFYLLILIGLLVAVSCQETISKFGGSIAASSSPIKEMGPKEIEQLAEELVSLALAKEKATKRLSYTFHYRMEEQKNIFPPLIQELEPSSVTICNNKQDIYFHYGRVGPTMKISTYRQTNPEDAFSNKWCGLKVNDYISVTYAKPAGG